jgi:hypothetical protein
MTMLNAAPLLKWMSDASMSPPPMMMFVKYDEKGSDGSFNATQ